MKRFDLSAITLGTAQFGSTYGIANETGCPSDAELCRILNAAETAGVRYFDTARAYGNAEERLGRALSEQGRARWGTITKLAPLTDFMAVHGLAHAADAVARSIEQSLAALNTEFIDIVMFHRSADMEQPHAIDALENEMAAGRLGEAGVSVYETDEALRCLSDPRIRHIQIPFNVLDQRWLSNEFQDSLVGRPDVKIHARSAFLQGLLLAPPRRWPDWVENAGRISDALDGMVKELGCESRTELCLRYNASMPWIETTVLGVDTALQFEAIAAVPIDKGVGSAQLAMIGEIAELAPPRLLNPALW